MLNPVRIETQQPLKCASEAPEIEASSSFKHWPTNVEASESIVFFRQNFGNVF